jgi:hypothetical protein
MVFSLRVQIERVSAPVLVADAHVAVGVGIQESKSVTGIVIALGVDHQILPSHVSIQFPILDVASDIGQIIEMLTDLTVRGEWRRVGVALQVDPRAHGMSFP